MATKYLTLAAGGLAYALSYEEPDGPIPSTPWFEDSFEGTPPSGWKANWSPVTPPGTVSNVTTDEAGTPTGGSSYAFRQRYLTDENTGGLFLTFSNVPGMTTPLGTGAEIHISYHMKYDALFDWGSTSGFKQLIMQSNSGVNDRMYIDIWAARMGVQFQVAGAAPILYSNTNGNDYQMPKGEWVKFDWYVKVSPETENLGILKGWVNNVLRWDYSNIATIESGGYTSLNLNNTFNERIEGPNQNRYWDLFYIGDAS